MIVKNLSINKNTNFQKTKLKKWERITDQQQYFFQKKRGETKPHATYAYYMMKEDEIGE